MTVWGRTTSMYVLYSDLIEERKAPISERKAEKFSFCRIVGFFLRNKPFDIGGKKSSLKK